MAAKNTCEDLEQKIKELEAEVLSCKQKNASLEKKGKYLQAFLDNTNLPIYLKTADYKYMLINREYERLAHITNEEIIGKTDFEIFPESVAELFRSQDILVKKSKKNVEFRETIPLADGIHTFITSKFPLYDDNDQICAVGGVCTDITEINQIKEDLKESEEKYRKLFTNEIDAIAIFDIETRKILDVNCAFLKLYGYGRKEALSLTADDISAESEKTRQAIHQAAVVGEDTLILRRRHRTKDGTEIIVTLSAGSFVWKGRDVMFSIIRDISAHVKADEEKAALETQLRQVYKMEAIGTMAGGIAHDFNNILTIIVGNADLARYTIGENDPARINIENIIGASSRAREIVRQILTFSSQAKQNFIPVNPALIFNEAMQLLRSTIPATIEINQQIDANCKTINADSTQLNQVLINLCSNAVSAMDENGCLELSLKEVNLKAKDLGRRLGMKPGKFIRLSVRDNGPGINPENQERIFDPFFTTKEAGKGTGMGLSVVHGIVTNHGGMIIVESEPGAGATFHVYFPVIAEKTGVPKDESEKVSSGVEHIMFVDDEEALVAIGTQMLELQGYRVSAMTSSIEALEAFKAAPHAVDLVITDQTMPNMTGAQLATALLKVRADIPIILCTGYSSKISEEKAKALGVRDFFMKPFNMKQLSQLVRKTLDSSENDIAAKLNATRLETI
ncbi:MAG: PAS domain S-box protein [Proteobacteria bacterium]|nr:PAS domain S-box protein [Pseudomonadota bacterium]MBU1709602.1 PAS domain S-box protein [Pseudomonadota bacterium]